ncbi:MAG: tRNA(His) guanylyltransferase Thg1 family protein [Euryarchaeota archaeon]|nr:tRNA(His) guanylyltransferase Thg1 family protein [Euryarchaeota archaeon]
MKEREIYAGLRCAPPVIIRIDGRSFKHILERMGCEKPYDRGFASTMAEAVELFFKKSGMDPTFAYTFSDEMNFLFLAPTFDRRVEKLDSIVPSFLSSAFTLLMELDEPISFDSRIIPIDHEHVSTYMVWRQREAWRNCISSYGYYTLRSEGLSERDAALALKGKNASDVHELLFKRGINLARVPTWQRRGIAVYRDEYQIDGFNPVLNEKTSGTRRRVVQDWELPVFNTDEGENFLKEHTIQD